MDELNVDSPLNTNQPWFFNGFQVVRIGFLFHAQYVTPGLFHGTGITTPNWGRVGTMPAVLAPILTYRNPRRMQFRFYRFTIVNLQGFKSE